MATPPVPTQRKVKLTSALKSIQSEQASKLQNKFQLETDLLEDIKSYAKQRAAAESQYSQAMSKITNQLLGKFQNKEENKEEDLKTPYGLWRKILEDTEKLANARLKVSQTLTNDVIESIKNLKIERTTTIKKCSTLNDKLHEELMTSANEMVKSQKGYAELQKNTIKEREAVNEAQEKIRKGTIGLFSSKAKQEKTLSKANERREIAEKRSTSARNDYLLYIAATNAHQMKYYALDLPDLIAVQDGNIYENFKEYYNVITEAEKEVCEQELQNIQVLQEDIEQLQRAHAIQFFLKENPVFTKCIPYDMMPCIGDEVCNISHEFEAGLALNKEARKWCNRMVQKQKMIRKKNKQLTKLKQAVSTDNDLNQVAEPPQPEKGEKGEKGEKPKTREEMIEALTEEIRHLEVIRTKAEGRIQALKLAGIDTDNWLQGALTEIGETDDEDENENHPTQIQTGYDYSDEDNDFDAGDWDDPPNENLSVAAYSDDALSITSSDVTRTGTPAVIIYPFEATSPEELTVNDNEEIDFLETLGDGWCKVRNKSGQVGFVPESYIEVRARGTSVATYATSNQSSTSSPAGSTVSDAWQVSLVPGEQPLPEVEVQQAQSPNYVCYAKAVYDYDACEDEELSFKEGDVIMVTSQEVDDDDGWWEGVLNGKRGVFPSIVVEETTPPVDVPVARQRAQTDQYNSSTYNHGTTGDVGRTYSMINERT